MDKSPILSTDFNLNFVSELFRSWFINFDFTGRKISNSMELAFSAEPNISESISDIFSENLVDSELGPIPKGWKIGKLGDYVSIVGGGNSIHLQ